MGMLVMSFRGLCMQMTAASKLLPAGVGNRVVTVNATNGAAPMLMVNGVLTSEPLPPHLCFLETDNPTALALWNAGVPKMLDGWNVQVVNGTSAFAQPPSIPDLPHLTTYVPGLQLLPDLGNVGAPASDACCFVDMQAGSLEQHQFQNVDDPGFFTTWTIFTNGDPQLRFLSRDGTSITVTVPSTPPGETLSDGVFGSIVLHNSTTNLEDKAFDFALYYLAAQGGIPSGFAQPLPGSGSGTGKVTTAVDMTTSCSNSQFP